MTTVSRRRRATVVIDGEEVATVGCTSAGRDTIVGAGEHVETTELVHMQLGTAIIPVLTARLKATKRALTEEVGLAPELLERARVWLIGSPRQPPSHENCHVTSGTGLVSAQSKWSTATDARRRPSSTPRSSTATTST